MWRFVSAARMAQIKADARAEGYIKAVREGLAASDAAKEAKQGQQIGEPHIHTADRAVQEIKQYVNQAVNGKRRHNRHSRVRASYADSNLQLIAKGASVKDYIFKHIGKLTHAEMAKHINKNMGTHVRGAQVPIKVDGKFVGMLLNGALVWDEDTNTFINLYYRSKKK